MKKEKVPLSSEIISNDGFMFECCSQRNKDKVDIKVIEDYLEDCALGDCYYFEQYHIYLLLEEYKDLKKQLEQKENIIKEAKEYIYKNKEGTDYSGDRIIYLDEEQIKELLEILQGDGNV